ncbi:unnamed protein product, partial [marine sediment metagenome]
YHPAGVSLKGMGKIFDEAAFSNADGTGIMYRGQDGNVIGMKSVKAHWDNMLKDTGLTKHHEFALHWRMATHGAVSDELCHPFPFNREVLLEPYWKADCGIMHNGVMSNLNIRNAKLSDTAQFIQYCIKGKLKPWLPKSKGLVEGILNGDRLLVWHKDHPVTLYGNWEQYKKCYFSNSYSLPTKKIGYQTTGYPPQYNTHNQWDTIVRGYDKNKKWVGKDHKNEETWFADEIYPPTGAYSIYQRQKVGKETYQQWWIRVSTTTTAGGYKHNHSFDATATKKFTPLLPVSTETEEQT